MSNKKIIFIISILLISIFIGLCSSASLAYFNNDVKEEIDVLKIEYTGN